MRKSIPYIAAMILIIPFFVLVVFATGLTDNGKELLNSNMSMSIGKENGVLDTEEGMPLEITLTEDGNYNLSYSWDVAEPGFLTSITVEDSNGNCVYNDSAFQVTQPTKNIFLKKGTYVINWKFAGTEEEFVELNEKLHIFDNETALNDYLDRVDFDSLSENGTWNISFSAGVYKPFSSPLWLKALCILLSVLILLLLIILLISDRNTETNAAEGLDKVSLRFSVFSLAVTFIQLMVSLALASLNLDSDPKLLSLISFALIAISVDLIGFPLICGLTKNIPAREIPKQKIGFFGFIPYIFMTVGIVIVGMIIGTLVHNAITSPFGGSSNVLSQLLLSSSPIPRILVVGILAPVFEELIFRKILIDRLSKYGTFLAILVSGLFFGLFHGNFSQFFFAAMLGFLFAFLYAKTGKVILTIILHMMVNLGTSVVTTFIYQKILEVNPSFNLSADYLSSNPEAAIPVALLGLWFGFAILVGLIGIVIFIIFAATKKFRLERNEGDLTVSESFRTLFTSRYSWLFILSCIGLFLFSYLPTILGFK